MNLMMGEVSKMIKVLDILMEAIKGRVYYNSNRIGEIVESGLKSVNERFQRIFEDDNLYLRNHGYDRGRSS